MDTHSMLDTSSLRMSIVFERPGSDIQKAGYLKKLKTAKKKYFVLRSTSSSGPARLEYYDTEKKFKNNQLPKRSIQLHQCFNINKKSDTRAKNTIALYTKDDCFAIVAESTAEHDDWLRLLLEFQDEYTEGEQGQSTRQRFEYVWQVTVKQRGLGVTNKTLSGQYRMCLSTSLLCLVRNNSEQAEYSFQLSSIRRCGHTESYFFMDVGRSAPTGPGELWIQVDDSHIAQTMHEVILTAMRASSTSSHDQGTFRKRSSTNTSSRRETFHEGPQQSTLRPRTGSESRCHGGSPRKTITRPQSTAFQRSPNTSSEPSPLTHSPNPISPHLYENSGMSPHSHENPLMQAVHNHRYRSDSAESRGSRSSLALSIDMYGSSPAEPSMQSHRAMTPESIRPPITEESAYLPMTPGHRSTTPSPPCPPSHLERSISGSSDAMEITGGVKRDGYIEMKPTGSVGSSGNDSGYLDMALNQHKEDKGVSDNSSYMVMGHHSNRQSSTSIPVPHWTGKEPGYMDMNPTSSQPLPTVKEGGSGEAYLPMSPMGMSPVSNTELRPAKVISYLSDDSMSGEFPKRAYSLGSRPVSKTLRMHQQVQEPPPVDRAVTDNGRSSSAPHLIVQKIKNQNHANYYMPMDSPNLSCSPSMKSDDSDSFMELDFYRPRTSSDSFGYRPRASSFGKMYNVTQGHRPRSSSYGQSSRGGKQNHHLGSFESVRTTSKELLHKRSQESLSRFSTASSKASSSESLRKQVTLPSDYVDMTVNKNRNDNSGYIDMTIGTTGSKTGTSRSSSSQSLSSSPAVSGITSPNKHEKSSPDIKIIKASGHIVQKPIGFSPLQHSSPQPGMDSGIPSQTSLFSPISFMNVSGGSRSPSVKGRSPASSGEESEDDYMAFDGAPGHTEQTSDKGKDSSSKGKDSSSKSKDDGKKKKKQKEKHEKSSKSDDKHKHADKHKESKEAKKKEKEAKQAAKNVTQNVSKPKEPDDAYLQYEPGTVGDTSGPHEYKQMSYSPKSDARKAIQVSKQEHTHTSPQDFAKNSSRKLVQKEDETSGYMDFNPAENFKNLSIGSNNSPETSPQLKTSTGNAIEAQQSAIESQKSKNQEKKESYQYMDFDPANYSAGIENSEVKSPTQARSYFSTETEAETKIDKISPSDSKKSENAKILSENKEKKNLEKTDASSKRLPSESAKTDGQDVKPPCKGKNCGKKDVAVKKVGAVLSMNEEVDDGYVGLDFSSGSVDLCEDGSEHQETDLLKPLPAKSEISLSSDSSSYKGGIRRLLSAEKKEFHRREEVPEKPCEGKLTRKISAPCLDQLNNSNIVSSQRMSPARKVSTSSLNDEVERRAGSKDNGKLMDEDSTRGSCMSELHKQNSMPCMNIPLDQLEQQKTSSIGATRDFTNSPRSRHSYSDLAGAYEQMNFPTNLDTSQSSSQQLTPQGGAQLNYASLDLGSAENVDDPKSPRVKSRHPSSADEATGPPLSYAQIDFKKSENLKNSQSGNGKDVNFSLD